MAINTIEYVVDIEGVAPNKEQLAGTQGDHKVTCLNFKLSNQLYYAIISATRDGKAMYRFDVYDGEGGIWQSEPKEFNNTMRLELEERHTRFGGKITVYLVVTTLSAESETEIELYSFPAMLWLKNRPSGTYKDGENYESVTGLVDAAKKSADIATESASYANQSKQLVEEMTITFEEKLEKYADEFSNKMDQTYSPTSENAQSGKAVAEAVQGCVQKVKGNGHTHQVYAVGDTYDVYDECTLIVEDNDYFENGSDYGNIPSRQGNGNLMTNAPVKDLDCTNKAYVDGLVGDIETLLGGI